MRRFALLAALLFGFAAPAAAEYPERPLTIVVAYPAGGMVTSWPARWPIR